MLLSLILVYTLYGLNLFDVLKQRLMFIFELQYHLELVLWALHNFFLKALRQGIDELCDMKTKRKLVERLE